MTGCASVISKSTYDVLVRSEPDQTPFCVTTAKGEVVAKGVTPEVVRLDAYDKWRLPAKYNVEYGSVHGGSAITPLKASVDVCVLGNIALGGPIGLGVDIATGAAYKLPEQVSGRINQSIYPPDTGQYHTPPALSSQQINLGTIQQASYAE